MRFRNTALQIVDVVSVSNRRSRPELEDLATGWSDSCRAGLAPAEEQRLSTAHATLVRIGIVTIVHNPVLLQEVTGQLSIDVVPIGLTLLMRSEERRTSAARSACCCSAGR